MLPWRVALWIAPICLCSMLGCTVYQTPPLAIDGEGNLVAIGYTMADKLAENASHFIGPSDPLIVASFVNVNNLQESSSFGRIIAQQITSRFAQRGQRVIELNLIREGMRELLLSRDMLALSEAYNATAVVVGTYADGGDRLYVSARIVRPTDNVIISAYDAGIPMDPIAMLTLLTSR